jgi:cytochrome c
MPSCHARNRISGKRAVLLAACAATLGLFASPALAAFSYPGCADVQDTEFKATMLFTKATDVGTDEPLKMAFDMDAQGRVDVYFVQRHGLLRKYDAATQTVKDLKRFTLPSQVSDGLLSVALDPSFKQNRWIYLYTTTTDDWRVVRYTLRGDVLDSLTEKVIIKIPSRRATVHTGSGMIFDWEGNLVVATADNAILWPSASSVDLRGKILRIKPRPLADAAPAPAPGPGSTYDIPAGNLFAPGLAKTRPEIYVMGTRNPYTLTMDPVRKALSWGDVGPDMGGQTEEHNLTTKPGNFGYPYFSGANIRHGGTGTAEKPIFEKPGDSALAEIPPALPALHPYNRAIAMTGPIYRYNPQLSSRVKFPPHFDGVWFVSDFGGGYFDAIVLDEKGEKVVRIERVLKHIFMDRPLDFQAGPDGAFYAVIYAGSRSTTSKTGIMKIEYTGNCHPGVSALERTAFESAPGLSVTDRGIAFSGPDAHVVRLVDLEGRLVWLRMGQGPQDYSFAGAGKPGVYFLKVAAGSTRLARKITLR